MITIGDEDDEEFADEFEINVPTDNSEKREKLYDGYLVDEKRKIVGEARRYDPYSRFGEIMLYEIDTFGFCPGYITYNWSLMSEEDLKSDELLRKELERTRYDIWKRHNIVELKEMWDNYAGRKYKDFEKFCLERYKTIS